MPSQDSVILRRREAPSRRTRVRRAAPISAVPSVRMNDGVALAAGAELDLALRVEVGERDLLHLAGHHGVVEAGAAALDQPPRLAVGVGEPGAHEQLEGRNT